MADERKDDGSWHNPIAPARYGEERKVDNCPFFMKTGACRFGDRCSRAHEYPETSCTILFPGMYCHFQLHEGLQDEYDTDITLEYEENETYRHFCEFYDDTLPEFRKAGKVVQFKVSCNYEPHLRGNVYVQYRSELEAMKAFAMFNGRFFAGRQLSCQYTCVKKWKNAICGLFERRKCPKGKNCNFLHVFANPRNEFWEADRDLNEAENRPSHQRSSHRGYSHHRYDHSHRYSSRHRHRSRSVSPRRRRSQSRSPTRHRSSSRSPSRYRAGSRSPHRHRSRSKSPSRNRSRSSAKRNRHYSNSSPDSDHHANEKDSDISRRPHSSRSKHKKKHKKKKSHKYEKNHSSPETNKENNKMKEMKTTADNSQS